MREERDRSLTFRQAQDRRRHGEAQRRLAHEALRRIEIELPPAERESTGAFELGKAVGDEEAAVDAPIPLHHQTPHARRPPPPRRPPRFACA